MDNGLSVPSWWTNYNKLKHDKQNNFDKCTLENLINSLGGLYILMNYFINYEKDNTPKIEENYWGNTKTENIWQCDHFSYKSRIFRASNSFQSKELCLKKMPIELHESKYLELKEKFKINFSEEVDINSIKKANGIFHIYFDYEPYINPFDSKFYTKKKFCKFNN